MPHKDKEKRKQYQKDYHFKNKIKLNARSREYQANNKEKILLSNKQYLEKNKEKIYTYNKNRRDKLLLEGYCPNHGFKSNIAVIEGFNKCESCWYATFWNTIRLEYGLNKETYYNLTEVQGNKCALCFISLNNPSPFIKNRDLIFQVDHCHKTHKVRGLLCGLCNRFIGYYKHDSTLIKNILQKIPTYLTNNLGRRKNNPLKGTRLAKCSLGHAPNSNFKTCLECKDLTLWRNFENKHGLTKEFYLSRAEELGWVCELCLGPCKSHCSNFLREEVYHIDHCHNTGKIRGFLCFLCNLVLGQFNEDLARFLNIQNNIEGYLGEF